MKKRLLVIGVAVALVLSGCSNSNDVKGDIESSQNTQKTKKMEERINLSPTEKVEKVKEYISDRIDNGDDVTTNNLQGDTINVGYSCHAKKDSEELLVNGKRVSPYFYLEDNNGVFDVRLCLSLDGTREAAIDDTIDKIEMYNTTQSLHYNSTSMNYSDMSLYGGEGFYYVIDLAGANDKEDKSEKIDSLYDIFNSQENIYINLTYAKDGVETLTVTDYLKKIILAELKYYKEALTYLPNEIKKENNTEETLPTPVISTAKDSAKKIKLKQSIKTKFVEMKFTGSKITRKLTPSGSYDSYKMAGAGNKFVYIMGDIKNLSKAEMYTGNTFVHFCFDNNYEYEGGIEVERHETDMLGGDLTTFDVNMKALQKNKMYLYAEVPNEVAKKYKTCTVTFGFAKNFEVHPFQEKDCDYLYRITIKQ